MKEVTKETFEAEVLKSDKPVVVDFWAPWCGPCRALAPALEDLASEYAGKVEIVKVNVDTDPDLAEKYGVRALPTLIAFKGGLDIGQVVGGQPKAKLRAFADSLV